MEFSSLVLVLLSVYSIPASLLIHYYFKGNQALKLEEYRQECISNRQHTKPSEWWQQVIVEAVKNPQVLDKLMELLPKDMLEGMLAKIKR